RAGGRRRAPVARARGQAGERARRAYAEEVIPRYGARASRADALRPARVLLGDQRLRRIPVAVARDETHERRAHGEVGRRVRQDAARGPEVRVGAPRGVVAEVEEAEVALEGAAVGSLVLGEC